MTRRRTPTPVPVIPEPAKKYFEDPYDWQSFTDGSWEEWRSCNFWRDRIMTPEEKAVLSSFNLTLEDVCNGRFGSEAEPSIEGLFAAWNERIGYHYWGF